jgi:hypothetical protein
VTIGAQKDAVLELLEEARQRDTLVRAQLKALPRRVDVMEVHVQYAVVVAADRAAAAGSVDQCSPDAALSPSHRLSDTPLAAPAWPMPTVERKLRCTVASAFADVHGRPRAARVRVVPVVSSKRISHEHMFVARPDSVSGMPR